MVAQTDSYPKEGLLQGFRLATTALVFGTLESVMSGFPICRSHVMASAMLMAAWNDMVEGLKCEDNSIFYIPISW